MEVQDTLVIKSDHQAKGGIVGKYFTQSQNSGGLLSRRSGPNPDSVVCGRAQFTVCARRRVSEEVFSRQLTVRPYA